jgi:hypothetical protein
MYRSTSSWPRHWLEVSGQLQVPAALLPGKIPYWTGSCVGHRGSLDNIEKWKFFNLPVLNSEPLVVQPVINPYTDYATADLWVYCTALFGVAHFMTMFVPAVPNGTMADTRHCWLWCRTHCWRLVVVMTLKVERLLQGVDCGCIVVSLG